MKYCLFSIGSFSRRALSTVCAAFSCDAAVSVPHLDIFQIDFRQTPDTLSALTDDFSACHRLLSENGSVSPAFFPASFSFQSCVAVLPQLRELLSDDASSFFYAALRGKNMPMSYRIDREGVEWAFSALLTDRANESCDRLQAFIRDLRSETAYEPFRTAILFDPADSFSAGAAMVLLPYLRQQLPEMSVVLFGIPETVTPLTDAFSAELSATLRALEERSLLSGSDGRPGLGADAMILSALPTSLSGNPESHRLVFLAAARSMAAFFARGADAPGLHVQWIDGVLTLSSLRNETQPFLSFLLSASWMLSDLIPALQAQKSPRSGRFRSLQLNTKSALMKNILTAGGAAVSDDLQLLHRSLKALMAEIYAMIQSLPDSVCDTQENERSWQRASDACGRYVTVASEYDVSLAEFEESGLSGIRPVHRESMADTADEVLQRRIDDMGKQVEAERASLNEILSLTDPIRVLQARQGCLIRCREALASAESKQASQSADADHMTRALLERRVRLLKAAVARCETDLSGRAPDMDLSAGRTAPASHENHILGISFLSALSAWLKDDSESACRILRDGIPQMLEGYTLPTVRDLWKDLTAACKKGTDSLSMLFQNIRYTCAACFAGFVFPPVSSLPRIPLLPNPVSTDPSSSLSFRDLQPETDSDQDAREAELRGLLAMLVLQLYRRRSPNEAKVSFSTFHSDSPLPRYWLSAHRTDTVHVLSLTPGSDPKIPFVLAVPGRMLIPAKRTQEHIALIPSFVTWYDAASGTFRDPCDDLSEGNRTLLLSRLEDMINRWSGSVQTPLYRFLSAFRLALARERLPEADPDFSVRISAVCGLQHLSAYAGSLQKVSGFYEHFLPDDPVASCLTGEDRFPAASCAGLPGDVLYTWRGIPFAVEDSRLILRRANVPEEAHALRTLESECQTLSGISDDYQDALSRESALLLDRFPDAFPDRRDTIQAVIRKASRPISNQFPELVWPWDPHSPSVQTVLQECFGDSLARSAATPFSDLLIIFPARGGDIIKDALFGPMCTVKPYGAADPEGLMQNDAALPPLSPELARAVCHTPEGRMLLTPDLIRFDRPDESSYRVTLTMNGAFPLRLVRIYGDEEILRLYSNDIPTVALWPSLPLPADQWHSYFLYAHLPEAMRISVLSESASADDGLPAEKPISGRSVSCFRSFPSVFLFHWNQQSIGILPNLLPAPQIEPAGAVTACIDFGSVGTSVIFSGDFGRKPLHGPTMVRIILNNPSCSPEFIGREFLPAVPVSALLPTASRIFRNVPGAEPVPFADGIVLMSANLPDLLSIPSDALYTCLKWEEEKGRSGLLCLHQVMLMTALQARMDGAGALSWRFAIPDEMAPEGRMSLQRMFCGLVRSVAEESGYLLTDDDLPVSFASESAALGAYFRLCAWEDTRGGFMVTDIGACTVDISLFLRGREQAVRSCQIPLGVHYMLLPSLLHDPEMMRMEFNAYPDPVFQADLDMLTRILAAARTDPPSLRKARMSLDHFLTDHYPHLIDAMGQRAAAGLSSRFGAVLLLHLSYLLMLSGLVLLQIAADPNKNDFLPEQMTLCLSGRGSLLLELLPDPLKTALWRFLTMFRNKRVASMSLLFSAEKKMEIPVGLSLLQQVSSQLPPASAIPSSVSVRPEELLPEFLLRFARVFPAEANLLFPGFFTGDIYHPFSQAGEAVVTAAIDQAFTARETPRPYDSLAAWIGNLLDAVQPVRP